MQLDALFKKGTESELRLLRKYLSQERANVNDEEPRSKYQTTLSLVLESRPCCSLHLNRRT